MAEKDYLIGCSLHNHDEWQDDCTLCIMNKDVYENYSVYQAVADI